MATTMTMPERAIPGPFSDYELGTAYDEMFRANGRARLALQGLVFQAFEPAIRRANAQ